MTTKHFFTQQGENDCIEIFKIGEACFSHHMLIGFITTGGKLFFDTDKEQVDVPVIFLNELKKVFEAAFKEQQIRYPVGLR